MTTIIGLGKIKYPPGTVLAAKHNKNIRVVVTEVTSWHSYNSVIWKNDGVHLNFSPQYSYDYLDNTTSGFCSENSMEDQFEVAGFIENYQRPVEQPLYLCPITDEEDWILWTLYDEDTALEFSQSVREMDALHELGFVKRHYFGGYEITTEGVEYLFREEAK